MSTKCSQKINIFYISKLQDLNKEEYEKIPPEILFNLFRDYLSTQEQKAKIIRIQNEESKFLLNI